MAKFCASCGAPLQHAAKFCGSCGFAIPIEIQNCPTCGQEWDGKIVASKSPASKPALIKTEPLKTETIKSTPVIQALPEVKSNLNSGVVAHNTTARVQPVYGALYVEGKDCPNCGSVNMANKTCKTCESEN